MKSDFSPIRRQKYTKVFNSPSSFLKNLQNPSSIKRFFGKRGRIQTKSLEDMGKRTQLIDGFIETIVHSEIELYYDDVINLISRLLISSSSLVLAFPLSFSPLFQLFPGKIWSELSSFKENAFLFQLFFINLSR